MICFQALCDWIPGWQTNHLGHMDGEQSAGYSVAIRLGDERSVCTVREFRRLANSIRDQTHSECKSYTKKTCIDFRSVRWHGQHVHHL